MSSARPPGPSLAPARATEILAELLRNARALHSQPWNSPERKQWTNTARAALEGAFAPGSSILQSFETADAFVFNVDTTDEEMRQMENSSLESRIAVLRSAIDQLRWQLEGETKQRIENTISRGAAKGPTGQGPGSGPGSRVTPQDILHEAIRAVPAVKYALGVAGIVAAIAIIQLLRVNAATAAFGTVIMIILMTLLVIFARLVRVTPSKFVLPAQVLTWFALLIAIATASLLFTSVFWRWPVDLQNWLKQRSADTGNPRAGTPLYPKVIFNAEPAPDGTIGITLINAFEEPIDDVGVRILKSPTADEVRDIRDGKKLRELIAAQTEEFGTRILRPQSATPVGSLSSNLMPRVSTPTAYQIDIYTRYEPFTQYTDLTLPASGFVQQRSQLFSNKTKEKLWEIPDPHAAELDKQSK